MLPTFIVIGAMKGGSTSLTRYLQSHPDIFMATEPVLEPEFFSWNWDRGVPWYQSLFEAGRDFPVRGERSNYARAPQMPGIPERIASVVPEAQLVYLLRNPVERVRSMYVEWADKGWERRPIVQAVREDPRYVDWSRYAFQIDQYLDYFDRERMLVVRSEDLRVRRDETLSRVLAFVGATPDPGLVRSDQEWNPGIDKRHTSPMWDATRAALARAGALSHIPKGLKRRARRTLNRRRIDSSLPPAVEEEIWEELADDLARLRVIVGDDFELWNRR